MIIRTTVGPLACNARLLVCPETGEAAWIDAGDEAERLISDLKRVEQNLGKPIHLRYLLHTHAHFDHVGATKSIKATHQEACVALHRNDLDLYEALPLQGQLFGFQVHPGAPVEKFLLDEEILEVGKLRLSVLHTPGHSPGGVCFRLHEDTKYGVRETLFSGDTLFRGSVGRTDLWGGDADGLKRSIERRLLPLDDETQVLPGHGDDTLLGIEKRSNPYLGSRSW